MADGSGFQVAGDAPDFYERYVAPIMAPFVAGMLERVDPAPGSSLIDVACGTGFVTRRAAERVGGDGRVVGVDLNPMMLAKARSIVPDVEFHEASAQELPFADDEFESYTCQQGYQFFPDRDLAASEALRVVAPGGVVAVTVWTPMVDSPYFREFYAALADLAGADAVASYAAAFEVGGKRVAASFDAAGAVEVAVESLHPRVRLHPVAEFVEPQILATPWAATFAALDADRRAQAVARVVERLEGFADGRGGVEVPFGSDLVTARVPA